MKTIKSLALLLALLMIFSVVFTGCAKADEPEKDVNIADEEQFEEDFENVAFYRYWWPFSSYYSKSTQKATQKATEKATQKVTQAATQPATQKPTQSTTQKATTPPKSGASVESVMTYSGKAYSVVYNNRPDFSSSELTTNAYEFYSPLDSLGRCGYAISCVGKEIMPTEPRTSISSVKPTGWIQKTYDTSIVNGGSLYNRCHLIGFQLTGENANKKNLITGTRYMNENMIPFENMIADYIKETGNHVMYRVTPIFEGNNLVASGVHMEAYSVEDNGAGVCFNVYAYNVQPGVVIEYKTGASYLANSASSTESSATYILNTGSKKIHKATCSSANTISAKNKKEHTGSLDSLLSQGYTACGSCKPLS